MDHIQKFPRNFVERFLQERDIGYHGTVSMLGQRTIVVSNQEFLVALGNKLVASAFIDGSDSVVVEVSYIDHKYTSVPYDDSEQAFTRSGAMVFTVRAGSWYTALVLEPTVSRMRSAHYTAKVFTDGLLVHQFFSPSADEVATVSVESVHASLVNLIFSHFLSKVRHF